MSNIAVMYVATGPTVALSDLLSPNREEYARINGWRYLKFEEDIVPGRHYSWNLPAYILKVLKEMPEIEYVCSIGNEVIVKRMRMNFVEISFGVNPQYSFHVLSELITPTENSPNIWFTENNGTLQITQTTEPVRLLSTCGIIFRRSPELVTMLENIMNDRRFMEEPTLKLIPQEIDRFQIALSYCYNANLYNAREIIKPYKVSDFACLPKGSGEPYEKLRRIMRKVVKHDYAEFYDDAFVITIWCLSGGIDRAAIEKIVTENSQYIERQER